MISYEPLMQYLEENNISYLELAELTGFSSATMAKIRKGESMTMDTIDRLCLSLNIPVESVVKIIHDENEINQRILRKRFFIINLKEIRQSKAMTQLQFAEILGYKQSQISSWENMEIRMDSETIEKLKNTFNLRDEDLQLKE